MDIFKIKIIFTIIHLFGLALGAGGAFLSDIIFFHSIKDKKVSLHEFEIIKKLSSVVWFGLILLLISGAGLFALEAETLISSSAFLVKMTLVSIIILNGVFFHFIHIPFLHKAIDKKYYFSRLKKGVKETMFTMSGVVSMVSWTLVIILGGLKLVFVSYSIIYGIYIFSLGMGFIAARIFLAAHLIASAKKHLQRGGAALLCIGITLLGFSYVSRGNETVERVTKPAQQVEASSYSRDDVALHNNAEDCWQIVDDLVFNVTDAAKLHPSAFHCGEDVSVNYHKNHGKVIRDKMLVYKIGTLNDKKGITNIDVSFEKNEQLMPRLELYVDEGSWSPLELIFVVEKDAEKLLVIDGTTHEPIARIHDVGFQPHTSVFSSKAEFMYIISRDGWLTKISLDTLRPIISIRVGENSRGTALTDNDKYIAVGNYEPGSLVIVDAKSMTVVKEILLKGEINGDTIVSRAGAIVEDGNRIVAALKDLNSVWIVDTDQDDFPVSKKFWDIGNNIPTLHDGFLTPDGKYFIVASQGSKTAWVLDLETTEVVKEVKTGDTPHTGPGATWGTTTYIPALGEGLITAIDTNTWEPIAYIKTGGPGLFVRSYPKDPGYPYVWADTAFGENRDEIYVIDARTNKIVKTIIPVEGESSWHPEFTYDGKFVYIVSQSANEIEVYDAFTFEIVKRIESDTPSAVSNVGNRIEEPGL